MDLLPQFFLVGPVYSDFSLVYPDFIVKCFFWIAYFQGRLVNSLSCTVKHRQMLAFAFILKCYVARFSILRSHLFLILKTWMAPALWH